MTSDELQGVLIQNRLLTEEIRRRVNQLSAINSVAAVLSQSLDLTVTLEHALDSVLQVIPVEAAGISLIDGEAGELVLRAQRGWKQDFVSQPMRIKLGQGMSGYVLEHDEVVVTGDVSSDPRLIVPAFLEEKVQALAMAPMHARGRIIGIVSVMNYKPYSFNSEETDVLKVIADQLGVALDNALLYEDTRVKQSRLSAVIDSTADAIIATDNRGIINLVNDAAENLFNISSKKLLGRPLRETILHPKLREGILNVMEGSTASNAFFEAIMEGGRYLSVSVSPVHSPEPFPEDKMGDGWVIVIQDITHLRDSERNRARFIRTAAHDLRNPLSVTLSALSFLKTAIDNSGKEEIEVFEIAMTSITRMQMLVDDLLNLEQIQSGVELKMQPVEIADLLERAMLEVQPAIQHKKQHFSLEVADDVPMVRGDIRWLNRAVVNLLTNANKYTPENGHLRLRAWHDQKYDEIYIEVEDTGIGIAPSNRNRVFEMFFREPKIRDNIQGTGMGLAIVKSVVEQHGGRVYLKSEEGRGSTFGIILPVSIEIESE